jgi:tetratricopeptide (TPR) repeat protein
MGADTARELRGSAISSSPAFPNLVPAAGGWPPWLLGALFLAVYLATLNPWVSPGSLGLVASLTGTIWGPEPLAPVTYCVTLPLRWLPAALIPPVLNGLTAVCAALRIVLLARTVRLLPHKIFRRNFKPSRKPATLLTGPYAWLPPAAAVAAFGLQYTFWENATAATGGIFNLLLFAGVVRCLAEFSVSGKNSWLVWGAFGGGLAVANDWRMAAFFPAILICVLSLKGLLALNAALVSRVLRKPKSFNLRLLALVCAGWLAGFSPCLFKPSPAIGPVSGSLGLRAVLKAAVTGHLEAVPSSFQFLLVAGLVTMFPVVCLILRRPRNFGALKRLNRHLPVIFLHVAHGFFGLTCLAILLDSPLSPRWLNLDWAGLPLYYLAAVGAGYFAGHFLRLTEIREHRRQHSPARRRSRRRPAQRPAIYYLRGAVALGTGLLALATPVCLVCKNLPVIVQVHDNAVARFFSQIGGSLPAAGGVIIGDDRFLLDYTQAAVIRQGGRSKFLFVNASALLGDDDYYEFLKRQQPGFAPELGAAGPLAATNHEAAFLRLMQKLAQRHPIFCLQPSPALACLNQDFCAQPAGLIYQLKPWPPDSPTLPPPPSVAASEPFWRKFENQDYAGLATPMAGPPTAASASLWRRTMHFHPELDHLNTLAGNLYATALNNWGVELQQRGRFREAGQCFDQARQLDANNSAAQINGQFNVDYLAGRPPVLRTAQEEETSLTEYRDWKHVAQTGLVDEPNFCNLMGQIYANAGWYRPAIAQFERFKQFFPADAITAQNLAVAYFDAKDYASARHEAGQVLQAESTNATALFIQGISCVEMNAYVQAIPPLTALVNLHTNTDAARLNRAVCYLKTGQTDAARADYEWVTQTHPDAYPAYFNLAELADESQDIKDSIKYYQLYLKYAPGNQPQVTLAEARLKALKTLTR